MHRWFYVQEPTGGFRAHTTPPVRLSNITALLPPHLPPYPRTYNKSTGKYKGHKGTLRYIKHYTVTGMGGDLWSEVTPIKAVPCVGLLEGGAGVGTAIVTVNIATGALHANILFRGITKEGDTRVPFTVKFQTSHGSETRTVEESLILESPVSVSQECAFYSNSFKVDFLRFHFLQYFKQHCFIARLSDSTVSEDPETIFLSSVADPGCLSRIPDPGS